MFCAIYRSSKKEGMYLYIKQRDQFEQLPQELLTIFGKPQFVMLFNLAGGKPLINANVDEVKQAISNKGYYLQMPLVTENLHSLFRVQQGLSPLFGEH